MKHSLRSFGLLLNAHSIPRAAFCNAKANERSYFANEWSLLCSDVGAGFSRRVRRQAQAPQVAASRGRSRTVVRPRRLKPAPTTAPKFRYVILSRMADP